jgi:Ca-activated chloride channel family protein
MRAWLLGIAAVACQAIGHGQTFRAEVDVVRLPVTVTGRDGTFIHGLSASDFEVLENGRPQTIVTFAKGAGAGTTPIHLGVLLDRSDSMEASFADATAAVEKFVGAFRAARDTTLVEFDHEVRVHRFYPLEYAALFSRMDQKRTGLFTAFFDAMAAYVRDAETRGGEHIALIYSDGDDSGSRIHLAELQRILRRANVTAYAIGYLEDAAATTRFRAQYNLNAITRETGGAAFFPISPRELDLAYMRILEEVQSRYMLGYVSADPRRDGRFRKVEVKVRAPRDDRARARTRSGYVAAAAAAP